MKLEAWTYIYSVTFSFILTGKKGGQHFKTVFKF